MKLALMLLLLIPQIILGTEYYRAVFLTPKQIEMTFGNGPFSASKFMTGTPAERGKMAHEIVVSKPFVGKNQKQVVSSLGKPDSYFFNDSILAYMIEKKKVTSDKWHIIFLHDKAGVITEVKVHKKCCYSKPDWID